MGTTGTKVRRPRQERARFTVEAILEATAQILAVHALEGTTTARVAARAGVSVGTVYQYFPNKEALYDALVERRLADLTAARAERFAGFPDGALEQVLPWFVEAMFEEYRGDPALQHQLHRYELGRGLGRFEAFQEAQIALVEGLLRMRADRLRPIADPALTARVLVVAVGSVAERFVRRDPGDADDPALRRELAALIAGYVAPGNPLG